MAINEEILINIQANTGDAAEGIDEISRKFNALRDLLDQVDKEEVARRQHLRANAEARKSVADAATAQANIELANLQKVENEQQRLHEKSIQRSRSRSDRIEQEQKTHRAQLQ